MAKMTLKAARTNAGYNLDEAAALLGVSKTTLIKWEKGKTFPAVPSIEKICSVYHTHYDEIVFLPVDSLIANN